MKEAMMRTEKRNDSDPFGALVANPGNVLKLSDINADELSLALNADYKLVLRIGSDGTDAITFDNFDVNDVSGLKAFDHIEFDDGSTLSYDALMAREFDLQGTAGDDTVNGGAGNDLLNGGYGDDALIERILGLRRWSASRRWWDGGLWRTAINDSKWRIAA